MLILMGDADGYFGFGSSLLILKPLIHRVNDNLLNASLSNYQWHMYDRVVTHQASFSRTALTHPRIILRMTLNPRTYYYDAFQSP